MEKYREILTRSPLFAGIEPEKIGALVQALEGRERSYRKGGFILRAGEPVTALGLVLEGRALVVKEDLWGRRNLLGRRLPGQCFAETFAAVPGAVPDVSVLADTDCRVLFLDVQRALRGEAAGEYAPFVRNLLTDMAAKNLAFTEKLTHLGQRTTREKLLSYLSAVSQQRGSVEFDIPFSRQQLADYLLVERSGLSAELSRMRGEGLLDYRKNHFVLKPEGPGTEGDREDE